MTAVIVLGFAPSAAIGKMDGKGRDHPQFIRVRCNALAELE